MLDIVHILTASDERPPSLDALLGRYLEKQKFDLEMVAWGAYHIDPELASKLVNRYSSLSTAAQARLLLSPIVCETLIDCRIGLSREPVELLISFCTDEIAVSTGFPDVSDTRLAIWSPMCDEWIARSAHGYARHSASRLDSVISVDFDSPMALLEDPSSACLCHPAENFSADERNRVLATLSEALAYVDTVSETFGRLIRNYTRVIRVRKSDRSGTASEQAPHRLGQIYLLNPHRCEAPTLAESVIHESVHNLLSVHEQIYGQYVLTPSDQRFRPVSPWTGNPIPVESFCHAVFVWFALFNFACRELEQLNITAEHRVRTLRQLNRCAAGFVVPAPLSAYLRDHAIYRPGLLEVVNDLQQLVQARVMTKQVRAFAEAQSVG